jgi:hypothetical protein
MGRGEEYLAMELEIHGGENVGFGMQRGNDQA